MVRMINSITGSVFWVHESRVEEYLEAGHKLASVPVKAEEPAEPVKRPPTKKRAAKKKE